MWLNANDGAGSDSKAHGCDCRRFRCASGPPQRDHVSHLSPKTMASDRVDPAAVFLLAMSVLADALGIAAYLGLESDRTLRVAICGTLTVVAVGAGLTSAVKAAKKWRGARGPFELSHQHRNRAIASLAALLFAIALAIATVDLAASHSKAHGLIVEPSHQEPAPSTSERGV
jgi:membrane protease YdiL (CAAX protease family)